ncbi:hypothetical protein [Reichenbachiella versicolor]|uniref:hypothetical protein n=1 Tax=Reichenbachiella versicolor TaxID=1821036 RepID=UPI000D6DFCCA|nr:hypothetical protein [Reichenbachiella versicolor]
MNRSFFFLCICLNLFLSGQGFSQKKFLAKSRTNDAVLKVKTKKVLGTVSLDGEYFKGKPKISGNYFTYDDYRRLSFSEIGVIEVKKVTLGKVAGAPFKWIGGALAAIGLVTTAAAVEDDESDDDLALFGLSTLVAGGVIYFIGYSIGNGKYEPFNSLEAKDWMFEPKP